MEKTILITGKDTFLGNEILQSLSLPGTRTATTVQPRSDVKPHWDEPDRHLVLPWNRRSSLGAKNLLLDILSRYGHLDQAWLVLAPEMDNRQAEEVGLTEMEEKIDHGLKGFFYLLRELRTYSKTNPDLEINFVLFHEKSTGMGPLSFAIYSGFQGLGMGAINLAKNTLIRGFESAGNPVESFVGFLSQQALDQKPTWGKWQVYQEKKGFFKV